MSYQNSGNSENKPNGQETDCRDWREQRREWRRVSREARYRDPWHGLFGGLILLLIGALFLFRQNGWLPGDNLWEYLIIGIGAILIISGLVRYSNPQYRHYGYGRFIAGPLLILAGVFSLVGWSQWWPVLLIAGGAALLIRVFIRREQNETP
jgi:hypothetical protein